MNSQGMLARNMQLLSRMGTLSNSNFAPVLSVDRTTDGYVLSLSTATARTLIKPLAAETSEGTLPGTWDSIMRADGQPAGILEAHGHIDHPQGTISFRLELHAPSDLCAAPLTLRWRAAFEGSFTGAVVHPVVISPLDVGDSEHSPALDLPSINYSANSYGKGLFPHPNLAHRFAFRADRMGQPAIHVSTPEAVWSYYASDECPLVPEADRVYSLGATGPEGHATTLFFRYPQAEYGHRGDGGPDAYIAKSTFAPGENLFVTWQQGTVLEKTLYLWLRPPTTRHDDDTVAHLLWESAYPSSKAGRVDLWKQTGQHVSWYNARLFNPEVAGGQYESPEGSGTAMLGFVEQSLLMPSVTVRYSVLSGDMSLPGGRLSAMEARAARALTGWAVEGRSPEGLLYPAAGASGFFFGWRDYSDYENLTIIPDDTFDTIRLASESRSLLAAATAAVRAGRYDPRPWREAALSTASWLLAHPLPEGGYSPRYRRTGEALETYPSGTAAVIDLFCACAHLLASSDELAARRYAAAARQAYEKALAGFVRQGAFSGGTLDASCPDREAAIAVLDACLALYELLGDSTFLDDAAHAAANILSCTMVYPVRTFGPDTDSAQLGISTFGASIVSPENQHLDPVPTAPGLLRYGLYANDEVCLQAAAESLKWCLDGRWAVEERDGLKQSEQLLHTRWYYNTFFSRRGDFRRGMPLWGRTDSEHGWPQVVPAAALLDTGQICIDWPTGRAAAVDVWDIVSTHNTGQEVVLEAATKVPGSTALFLKIARLPAGSTVNLKVNDVNALTAAELTADGALLPTGGGDTVRISLTLAGRSV